MALFDWTAGGHRPIYVRRFVEALRTSADIVLALPQPTLDQIGDLGVDTISLGAARPSFEGRLGRHRRAVLADEAERLRAVASTVEQTLHLYADHVLVHLVTARPLPGALSVILYYPRGHYFASYGTRLPPRERAVALLKEWVIRRWRRRSDAHSVFTLDEEAALQWAGQSGAPAYWLPEPPVRHLSTEELTSHREGCVLYGSIRARKGLDLVAHALTTEPTTVRLVVAGAVGEEYRSELKHHIAAMRAAGVDVDLRPHPHSELEGLRALASARCALLPYPRHAGMSRVLLEACSVGTPVITDSYGLLGHLVRSHRLGIAVDTSDAKALRRAILHLTSDNRADSYAKSLARFAGRFTADQFRTTLVTGLRLPLSPREDISRVGRSDRGA